LCGNTFKAFIQVGQFAEFIVGDKCNLILPILALPEMNQILHGDDVCMDVHVAILPGLVWLMVFSVVGVGTTFYISHKLRQSIREGMHTLVSTSNVQRTHADGARDTSGDNSHAIGIN
jgi:hypothetical protein